jgi:hypothetical protein
MNRPFFNASIEDLEREYENASGDVARLKVLKAELAHRKVLRSQALAAKVAASLAGHAKPPRKPEPASAALATEAPRRRAPPEQAERGNPARPDPKPYPPQTNTPVGVLDAWTALEVLSPPSFRRVEQLAGGDRTAVAKLDGDLPWERGLKGRPGSRLYYQVILGTIDLPEAVKGLLGLYADKRAERPGVSGQAILAVVIVDKDGRPVEDDPAHVASFGWGLPTALAGGLDRLAQWPAVEEGLKTGLTERVRILDRKGEAKPLTRAMIDSAYHWLVDALGLPGDLVKPPSFAIRSFVPFRSAEPPEPLLLNSFYLKDLARARHLFARDAAPDLLKRYLGVLRPQARPDLFTDRAALTRALDPARYASGRWPGKGRHPLALLQQAAVNLALEEGGGGGGILAVNGPPGTGKTTLLRDLVAALVTERAQAMATFANPADAFLTTGKKIRAGAGWLHLYRLDERLKGFEMLVASSNNGAVENVSAELPGLGAVAEDAPELRYFKSLSDQLLKRSTWGLGAAVLGNAGNRYRFSQTFWWDREVGLSTYLSAAAGNESRIEADENGPARKPLIVRLEDPPLDQFDALERWEQARRRFDAALNASRRTLDELEFARIAAARTPALRRSVNAWVDLASRRPGFWSRLFWTRTFRIWRGAALDARAVALTDLVTAAPVIDKALAGALRKAMTELAPSAAALAPARADLDRAADAADRRRLEIGERFVDAAFFARDEATWQKAAPWLDAAAQRARDDVFIAAMALHKAFIGAAAKPLRQNLGAMMNVLGGASLGDGEKDGLIPDLWSSLFLVVPALSTTFASVDKMLGRLPPGALGWLLIDEAGQALPQAAVGALMRVKRAVIVGDPVQIPPVVTLPESLTAAIHRRFGVDPDHFNAPGASTQTLADSATPYMAEFQAGAGSRTVGVPLLVHRRCAEPMFGVSNQVAYSGKMVQAKASEVSPIAKVLGPSRWIDVLGSAQDKWSPEEGAVVIDLLRKLAAAGVALDLYVVTPFVAVADGLRALIVETGVLGGVVDDVRAWTRERIGTVHTVQGREAEAVIFVLGAPLSQQAGARGWAGGEPNLLNVAVTRAKEALYVVGSRERWRTAGVFSVLASRLETAPPP